MLLLLVIMSKSTGLIAVILFLIVFFNHLASNFSVKDIIINNYLLIFLLALWTLKIS